MSENLWTNLRKSKLVIFTLFFFVVMTVWWITIYARGLKEGRENDLFTVTYPWVSLWGGIAGLFIAKSWGGYKSLLGKAFGAFSIGLLGQAFGQAAYSVYIYVLGISNPYPSIGDIGYFGTGIFYTYGLVQLARATGLKLTIKSYMSAIGALILPVLFVIASYWFFLRGYEIDLRQPAVVFLDLISPILGSIYLSLAILVYLLSKKFLGGMMKIPILFLLLSLVCEAVSDFTFIYRDSRDLWYVGGINDYMYLVTYSLTAISLILLGISFTKITEEQHD